MSAQDELEPLFQSYIDGTLNEDGFRQLEDALNRDPQARVQFLEALKMHASLHVLHGGAARAEQLNLTLRQGSDRNVVPLEQAQDTRSNWKWLSLAACAAIVVLAYLATRGTTPTTVPPAEHIIVASLSTDGSGSIVMRDNQQQKVTKKFELRNEDNITVPASESAAVTLLDGSVLRMDGPCTLKVFQEAGQNRAHLATGEIDCHVEHQKVGPMIITTPFGRAVVLGTTFRLKSAANDANLEVVSGKVRAEDASGKNSVVVETNQRVRLAPGEQLVSQPIVPDIVGWWKFDEMHGNTSFDYSGQNNTATIGDRTTWSEGKFGGGIKFDGGSAPVTCGNPPSFNSPKFTVSAWFKSDTAGEKSGENIFSKDKTRTEGQYSVGIQKGSILRVNIGASAIFGTTKITPGEWHHVVLTYDGREVKLYLDQKVELARVLNVAIKDNGAVFLIGRRSFEQSSFGGVIDDVRIYSTALTAEQIAALR